ncbi:hypothetical protein [Sphingomonas sp.]|uniref:hypothetical protein n=1 Tax=Sphingomonas sp. TaxID=28214 RepID=UPI002EDB2700
MLVMAMILAGLTPQAACLPLPKGATAAKATAAPYGPWFINNEPIMIAKKTYLKYGLPRVLGAGGRRAAGAL